MKSEKGQPLHKEQTQALKQTMLRWKAPIQPRRNSRIPLTPDPSPQTSPTVTHWDSDDDTVMSGEEAITIREKSIHSSSSTPRLADVLNNTAPAPYTLSAFTAFLSQNHCLETLEFTMAARRYQEKYDTVAAMLAGMPLTFETIEVRELQEDWRTLMETFLSPGSLKEINLPAEVRDALLLYPNAVRPPPPDVLNAAIRRMHDLMQESIWMPFLHHYSAMIPTVQVTIPPPVTYIDEPMLDVTRSISEEKKLPSKSPRTGHSPSTSADLGLGASRSPNPSRPLSAIANALHKPHNGSHRSSQPQSYTSIGSSNRESTYDYESSGVSELDPITPPTTPPSSELGLGIHHPPQSPKMRTDSGAWKRMGAKLGWPRKKSVGTLRDLPSHEE